MKAKIVLILVVLSGCGEAEQKSFSHTKSNSEIRKRVAELRAATNIEEQIGRFQFHPASGEMPPLLFDTATGCIEVFDKLVDGSNPAIVYWGRRYDGAPMTEKDADGNIVGPPIRCPDPAVNKDTTPQSEGPRFPE